MKKKINSNNKIIKRLTKIVKISFPSNEIVSYTEIHSGYTNLSYLVKLNDNSKWQVRIPHQQTKKIINRKAEKNILDLLNYRDFVYFDIKTGIAIKKWFEGYNPNKAIYCKRKFLSNLFSQINHLHSLNIKKNHNFKKINLSSYDMQLNNLDEIYISKFNELVNLRKNDKLVINHTDINPDNILVLLPSNKIHLIDFEWVGLASDYWDYANFIRETNLNYKNISWDKYIANFDIIILKQYIYITSVFAYLWTFNMPQTPKIIKYRSLTKKQILTHYNDVK